jgi:hypothetical protein
MTNQKRKLVPQKIGVVDKRRRPRGLTRAIKTAIDGIMFDRRTRAEACERAGISERALYLGLQKVEVATYWNRQVDVLRRGELAANVHALTDVRDNREGNQAARVAAVRTLHDLEAAAIARPPANVTPGLVISIVTTPAPRAMVDVTSRPLPVFRPSDDAELVEAAPDDDKTPSR